MGTQKSSSKMFNKNPPVTQQPEQLTPNSSSSPYTITSSLSSSSSSLPPPVPPLPNLKQATKNSKRTSLLSLKSFESLKSKHSLNNTSICNTHKCFISIWSTWYCLLIIALHIYLLKNRIVDIVNLSALNSDLTFVNDTIILNNTINLNQLNSDIYFELISRLCLVILSIMFLMLFLLCSLKQFGNYSNDGIKFGRDFFYEKISHNHGDSKRKQSCFTNLFAIIWRHYLPVNSFCHLISILLLLFSRIIFDDSVKTTSNYSTIKQCLVNKLLSTSCLLNFFLMQTKQTITAFYTLDDSNINTFYLLDQIFNYKFELISICLAYISIYIRYGSVFWFTNKCLSFLITFIGFIATIEQLFQLYSFVYIYNQLNLNEQVSWAKYYLKENSTSVEQTNNSVTFLPLQTDQSFLHTFAASFEFTFLIRNKITLLFLYFTLSVLVYLSATPAYVFAFLKYKERFLIEESLFIRTIQHRAKSTECSISCSTSTSDEQAKLPTNNKYDHKKNDFQNSTCCFNYCPHLIATIQLVLICASKLPFCYDYVIYFNKFKDFGICLVIIIEILHTIILIFIWLLLTLKTEWNMHLQTAFSICHWTYHLKFKPNNHKSSYRLKTGHVNDAEPIKKQLTEANNESNRNSTDSTAKKPTNNYDSNQNKTGLLTYQQPNIIRTNPSNIYGSYNNQRQNMINTKHKSLIEHYTDDTIYNTNVDDIIKPLPGSSDYLLNSETLYRNEIRKSIRNIMQQKRNSANAIGASTGTLITPSSMAHMINQQNKQLEAQRSEPYYFQSDGKKRLIGGVYLTSTTPTIIDNSSTKIPTITHIVTSTICSTTNPRQIDQNKNRSVLYLERRSSSSNEYESRV